MAQFYKMTLYVCDLEDDLSLKEIKTLIDERALSGVSVNAICRFSNEQTGKQIAWHDDVDRTTPRRRTVCVFLPEYAFFSVPICTS